MSGNWLTGWLTGDVVTAAEFAKGVGAIFDSTAPGAVANFDVTSIPSGYANLLILMSLRGDAAVTADFSSLRFNNDSSAIYDYERTTASAASTAPAEAFAQTSGQVAVHLGTSASANLFSHYVAFIPNYANATNNKGWVSIGSDKHGTATTNMALRSFGGQWRSNSAITRVTILPSSGNFVAASRVTVYVMGR